MEMNKLLKAGEKAIKQALKIKKGENFLLITDKQKMEIAEALAYWAKEVGAEITTYLMTETLRPIVRPTKIFEEMIKKADVTAYMLDSRIEEKPFRGFMVQMGSTYGRICMMPGITRDMMERLVNVDFTEMNLFTQKVVDFLKDSNQIIIENPHGTKIEFSVKGRKWEIDNGDISIKGKHGNLPAGECYTAPVENTFTGKIIISLIDDKLGYGEMEFREGKLVNYIGNGVKEIIKTIGSDESGLIIGEFGIGTNKNARICPNMLEAEKAFGTVHFAIGDSYGLGKNKSKYHFDALVEKVTIISEGTYLIKDGKFLI
jgi:leucyl aminopeptidase (aminopeptidase T)